MAPACPGCGGEPVAHLELRALERSRWERSDRVIAALWIDLPGWLSRIEVGPLSGQALREAIVWPPRDLGGRIEPERVERLLADAGAYLAHE